MLPPIFSGPQKKQSQKTKQLLPLPRGGNNYRSQASDSSPIQYKSEVQTSQAMPQSERLTMDGSAMHQTDGLNLNQD